jgi:peptidyl-prolyl isomerase H (cyclophilin H)
MVHATSPALPPVPQSAQPQAPAGAGDPTDALLHHNPNNPIVFFDVTVGTAPIGRITLELFADLCPRTAENMRQFCTGEHRDDSGRPLGFKNVSFHRIIRQFCLQGGDWVNGDGTGCKSIYGGVFADENFALRHSGAGVLASANSGKDSNGCQFYVTCAAAPFLDGVNVVFGKCTSAEALSVVRKLEAVPVDDNSRPRMQCVITQCGEL